MHASTDQTLHVQKSTIRALDCITSGNRLLGKHGVQIKKNCCYDSNDDVLLVPHIGRTIDIQKKMLQKW